MSYPSFDGKIRDLESENADLRAHLDRKSRDDHRRRDEAEAARKQSRRESDPSNRLNNNHVAGFEEAVELAEFCLQREISQVSENDTAEMRQMIEKCNVRIQKSIADAELAALIYRTVVAEATVRAVQALRDAGLTEWAECLERSDYSSMAI